MKITGRDWSKLMDALPPPSSTGAVIAPTGVAARSRASSSSSTSSGLSAMYFSTAT